MPRSWFCLCTTLLLCVLLLPPPAPARDVRIASWNVLNGVGSVGSTEYNAVRSVLERVDADIVAFQELKMSDKPNWDALAAALGYPYTAFSITTPLSGSLYTGYYSRWPITSTFNVVSPPGANDVGRPPFRAVIEVEGALNPLPLWTLHHKALNEPDDPFRRAVEAIRCARDIDAYLAAHPTHDEYVVLGDFNDDVSAFQTDQFTSLPSCCLPGSYSLGADIPFPVPYRVFPRDAYEVAGFGMRMLPATHEDSSAINTFIFTGGRLDYIFVSDALYTSPLGAPETEVYNSSRDDGVGGLPKSGSALPASTSSTASDHYLVFVDVALTDAAPQWTVTPAASIDLAGDAGGPFAPPTSVCTVTNAGGSTLTWTASAPPWLSLSSTGGTVNVEAASSVTVSPSPVAATLSPALYTGLVSFAQSGSTVTVARAAGLLVRDELPDAWRIQYFGHADPRASDHSLAGDDPDLDGFTNLEEYIAGTLPTDIDDLPGLPAAAPAPTGIDFAIPSLTGRLYTIEFSEDLAQPNAWTNTPGVTAVPGTGSTLSLTDPDGAPLRAYRLRIDLAP